MSKTATLISNENDSFEVSFEKVFASAMVKSVIDPEYGDDLCEEEEDTQVPLPMISTPILRKIVDYMNHYGLNLPQIVTPLRFKDMAKNVGEWECNFLDMERDELMELLRAADYMDMGGLILLCSAKLANNIMGMSTEEMREYLGIVNDFTPEEEVELKKELEWTNDVFKREEGELE